MASKREKSGSTKTALPEEMTKPNVAVSKVSAKTNKSIVTGKPAKSVAHNDGREALLELTIREMAVLGPARVQPNELCIELGLAKSLVNFHFGGRDGLLGEALTIAYERYVDDLEQRSDDAGLSAVEKLLAWANCQFQWTIAHPGTACGLNFFEEGSSVRSEMSAELRNRIADADHRNKRNLLALVVAARLEVNASDPGFMDDPRFASLTASTIDWLTKGESISFVGSRFLSDMSPSAHSPIASETTFVRDVIVSLLERRPNPSA